MNFSCPRCQMVLNADPEMSGKIAHCPACGNRIRVPLASQEMAALPGPATAGRPAKTGKPRRSHWTDADPTNVNAWVSLGLGAAITIAGVLLFLPFQGSFVGDVFFTGGWVNYLELFLFGWGLAILLLKWRKTVKQRDALMLDVLPQSLGREINAVSVESFLDHILGLPERVRDSMMVNRIRKGLELFHLRRNNSEVASQLQTLSDVDANRISGSYSLLKVFLWAIPILGFIGTVLGLSLAMSGFGSADLTDVKALKDSVKGITNGLATAFNTTLFGLLLSMFLMFPMSAIQKREEDCLTDIDAFCNEVLLPRLNDGGAAAQELAAENPAGLIESVANSLAEQQSQFLATLTATTDSLRAILDQMTQQAAAHQHRVEEKLGNAAAEVAKRAGTAVEESVQFANKYFAALSAGVNSLNEVLKNLGEKQVVIQQVKKKGFFSR